MRERLFSFIKDPQDENPDEVIDKKKQKKIKNNKIFKNEANQDLEMQKNE